MDFRICDFRIFRVVLEFEFLVILCRVYLFFFEFFGIDLFKETRFTVEGKVGVYGLFLKG